MKQFCLHLKIWVLGDKFHPDFEFAKSFSTTQTGHIPDIHIDEHLWLLTPYQVCSAETSKLSPGASVVKCQGCYGLGSPSDHEVSHTCLLAGSLVVSHGYSGFHPFIYAWLEMSELNYEGLYLPLSLKMTGINPGNFMMLVEFRFM